MHHSLIGYACGWGAKDRRCADAPKRLQDLGLERHVPGTASWQPLYTSPLETSSHTALEYITDYCQHLCTEVASALEKKYFPITLGGDHSMAIGTWSGATQALNAAEEFGLIWFDAHMDAHTPQTSESGAYHGMPLACLLGRGEPTLCNIGSSAPKLKPEHLCLIGIRSYEEGEACLLKELGVRIFFMDEVKQRGIEAVVKDALAIARQAPKGYGLSMDIDAFDPAFAPGTGTREADGLLPEEALHAFRQFQGDPQLKALEIAEYNHHLGHDGITVRLISGILQAVLSS